MNQQKYKIYTVGKESQNGNSSTDGCFSMVWHCRQLGCRRSLNGFSRFREEQDMSLIIINIVVVWALAGLMWMLDKAVINKVGE